MPIQKFKYGQEITSSKLNEIVTFINSIETMLNNAQYWNTNIDSKINGFQNQLTSILSQITNVLNTTENFQSLLSVFVDLKAKYETLIANNAQSLIQNLFSPSNLSIDANGIVTLNGVNTGVVLKGAAGQNGSPGQNGSNGINGIDGNRILFGTSLPDQNSGNIDDLYINFSNFNFFVKTNQGWINKGSAKGPTGNAGAPGKTTLIQYAYKTNLNDTPYSTPKSDTKYLLFKNFFSTDTNTEINLRPWTTIQIRSDNWAPVVTQSGDQVLLSWSQSEVANLNPVNIKGPKGDRGDPGSFVIKGVKSTTGSLPANGLLGDAWFVGSETPYSIYVWDTGSLSWVNVGQLQGVAGPAPTITASITTLNAGENATITVTEPINDTFNLAFGIPRGNTGARGSLLFSVSDNDSFPTANPWVVGQSSTTLIVGDLFISQETGLFKIVTNLSPFTMVEVVQLPLLSELKFKGKVLEPITKGDLIQFVTVSGGNKLVAKASQSERSITLNNQTYTIPSCNIFPDLIMGVAAETVQNANSTLNIIDFGQITQIETELLVQIPTLQESDILYFDSQGTIPGRLTKIKPTGTNNVRVQVAAYIGGPQHLLQIRLNESKFISDIPGLQENLDSKASSVHTHTIANVTNLQSSLDSKAALSHSHSISDITNLTTTLAAKADLVSGKIPTSQLPAFVDDVIVINNSTLFFDLAAIQAVGYGTSGGARRFLALDNTPGGYGYALHVWLIPSNLNPAVTANWILEKTIGRFNDQTEIILDAIANKAFRISGAAWGLGGTGSTPPNLANDQNTISTNPFFVFVGNPLAIGETGSTAFAGNRGVAVEQSLLTKAALNHTHSISDITNLQTNLDGKASTTHSHLVTLYSGSPMAISNASPFTTLTLNANITAGDRLLIRWGSNSDVKFLSEVFLIASSGSDYYAVLEKRFDALPTSDLTAFLSVQMGSHLTSGSYTGNQLTFRNGMFQSLSGTQTTQTMYVQAIYKVVL